MTHRHIRASRTASDGRTLGMGRGEKLNRDREIPSAYVLFPVWLSSHGPCDTVHTKSTKKVQMYKPDKTQILVHSSV